MIDSHMLQQHNLEFAGKSAPAWSRIFQACRTDGFVLKKILPQRRDRMILFPAIGSQVIVTTSLFLMPFLIETLKLNARLSGKSAGLLLSMELAVSALTTLCLSAWVRKHSARHWALAGGLLTIIGTALTLISP